MMTAIKDHHTDSGDEDNQKEMVEAGQFVGSFGGYRSDELLLGQPDRFVSLGALSGVADARDGRASAYFDMDGDGDLDLAVLSLQGLKLFENRLSPKPREALILQLQTRDGQPALGATVTMETAAKSKRAQTVRLTNGTRGQQRPWLYFGLGQTEGTPVVTIKWPSGESDTLTNLFGHYAITQGQPPRRINRRPWPLMTKPRALAAISSSVETVGLGGQNHRIPVAGGKPQIVHVLSIDKQRALNEMTVLTRLANTFGERIRILAVFGRDETGGLEKSKPWPFATARLSPDLKKKLFGTTKPATMPASFVFDGRGRLKRAMRRPLDIRSIKLALDTGRTNAQDHLDMAMTAGAQNRLGDVKKHLTEALRLAPNSAIAWWRLGQIEAQEKQWPAAIAAFRKTHDLVPDDETTLLALGNAFLFNDQAQDAIEILERLSTIAPSAQSYLALARAYSKNGELEKGAKYVEFAREKNPELLKKMTENMLQQKAKQADQNAIPNALRPTSKPLNLNRPPTQWPTQLKAPGPK